MLFTFIENRVRCAQAKNNCQKCAFCVCKFNINSSVLLPNSVVYH